MSKADVTLTIKTGYVRAVPPDYVLNLSAELSPEDAEAIRTYGEVCVREARRRIEERIGELGPGFYSDDWAASVNYNHGFDDALGAVLQAIKKTAT